tara:strand:- start:3847 stop:4122 length:276 start_codon:yes stop_codon:yes gene_type:complete
MKRLKSAIEKAIDGAGIKSALDQEAAISLWNIVVGKVVSEVAKAEKVESGILIIKVDSSVWRQELHMQKKELVNKINNKIGTKVIRDIRFI